MSYVTTRLASAYLPLALFLLAASLTTVHADQEAGSGKSGHEAEQVDPRWLDRMGDDERAALEQHVGEAPPAFTGNITWVGDAQSWPDLRGRVVVLQTWTSASAVGRRWPQLTQKTLESFTEQDLQIIALHTPHGADKAERFLQRRPLEIPVAIDAEGHFTKALGTGNRPVNLLIDRHGVVRYAGLNRRGLAEAAKILIAENFDPSRAPSTQPNEKLADGEEAADRDSGFPTFTTPVGRAADFRGRSAPAMYVERWLGPQPNAAGKVVVLDFWATWCKPCRDSIPHMNKLVDRFGGDIVAVGVTDEDDDEVERGLDKHHLKPEDFHYPVAVDTSGRMKRAYAIRAIPHVVVISSDWIVRWQGHPMNLTDDVLRKIIEANRAMARN